MTDPHATTGAETTMTRVLDMLSSGVHDAKNQLFIAESLIVKAETEHGIVLEPLHIALWGIPTAICAFLIHASRLLRMDAQLAREAAALRAPPAREPAP